MADQVIIEFVGDTSKLEEAYNKLNDQVATSSSLNKESAAAFQKTNADIGSSFEHATDAAKKFNEQLRNLGSIVAAGVLKNIISDLKSIDKAQGDVAASANNIGKQIGTLQAFAQVGKGISTGFETATGALALFGAKNEDIEKIIVRVQAAIKVLNGLQEASNLLKEQGLTKTVAVETATKSAAAAEGIFAEASATAWAAATGGIALLVAAIGGVVYALTQAAGKTKDYKEIIDDLTKSQENEEALLRNILDLSVLEGDITFDIQKKITNSRMETAQKSISAILDTIHAQKIGNENLQDEVIRNREFMDKTQQAEVDRQLAIIRDGGFELRKIDTQIYLYKEQLAQESAERVVDITRKGFAKTLDLYTEDRKNIRAELDKKLNILVDADNEESKLAADTWEKEQARKALLKAQKDAKAAQLANFDAQTQMHVNDMKNQFELSEQKSKTRLRY